MIFLVLVMTLYWPDRSRASVSLSVFALILLVPVVEELFFRGVVLDFLLRRLKSSPLAVVLVSALFGLAHLPQGLTVAIVMLLLSIAFASVTLATGSLVWAIVLHLGWNALAVLRDLSPGTSRWSAAAVTLAAIAGLVILSMLRNRTASEHDVEKG
jgi:membrane protease YdiL (CAAX protease family)